MATLPAAPPQTAYIKYTAPSYTSPDDNTFGSIVLLDEDGNPLSGDALAYKYSCAVTLLSAYEKWKKGDSFEIEGISFWGMYEKDPGIWQPASTITRTFFRGEKGEVHFDPEPIVGSGQYKQFIDVSKVQSKKIEFTVLNNNETDCIGRIDFEITLRDRTGTESHDKRFTSRDPEIQLEKGTGGTGGR